MDSISQYSWTPEEVYEEVQGIQQSLDVRKHLLESKKKWSELVVSWNKEQLKSLDIDKLQSEVNSYVNTLDYLEKGIICTLIIVHVTHFFFPITRASI